MERFSDETDLDKEKVMGWLPLTHNMGLIGMHLLPLMANANQVLLTPQCLIRNTMPVLQHIKKEQISIIACPTFMMKWLLMRIKEEEIRVLDFSSIHTILMGAESINPQLVRNFETKFKDAHLKDNTICCGFGMAEASLIVSLQSKGEGLQVLKQGSEEIVLNGKPLEGVKVYTVDEQGNQLVQGEVGEIVVESPSIMKGYIGIDSSNVLKEGRLFTGDIGSVLEKGIAILGRKKDLLIINAKNYYASDLEMKIEQLLNVPTEYFALTSILNKAQEEIHLFIQEELYMQQPKVSYAIEKAFESCTGGVIAHTYIVKNIPKTVSGKKQRYQLVHLKDKYAVGGVEIETRDMTMMEQRVAAIWKNVLSLNEVDLDTSFFKLGGNSLSIIECIAQMKKDNLYITQEYFFKHPTIAEISRKLEEGGEEADAIQEEIIGEVKPLPNRFRVIENPVINQWNFSNMLDFKPMPSKEQLEEVVRNLLKQHDGLRHRIIKDGQDVKEYVSSIEDSMCIEWVICEDISSEVEVASDYYQSTLDIAKCPFKIVAFKTLGSNEGKILFLCHHVLVDAYAITIFIEDFLNIYKTVVIDQKSYAIQKKTTSLKEWEEEVHQFAYSEECKKDIPYWQAISKKHYHIPYDYEWCEEDNQMIFEKEYIFDLINLKQNINQQDLEMKFIGAWAKTIRGWTNQDDILLQYTLNGRHGIECTKKIDLSRTIGWMAFLVPLNIHLGEVNEKDEIIKCVKQAIHAIPHGGISYDCLKYAVKDEIISKEPMPEITFNYYDVNEHTMLYRDGSHTISIAKENIGMLEHPRKVRDRILDLVVRKTDEGYVYAKIHYSTRIHSIFTIKDLGKIFTRNVHMMLESDQVKEHLMKESI